jgi:hypothetical protein
MKLEVVDYSKDLSKLNKAQILSLRDISSQNLQRLKAQIKDEQNFLDAVIARLEDIENKEHVIYEMDGGLKIIGSDD